MGVLSALLAASALRAGASPGPEQVASPGLRGFQGGGDERNSSSSAGEVQAFASSGGLCADYGCGGAYEAWHPCQCNSQCGNYGNCCPDYQAQCSSCAGFGCGGSYEPAQPCQCNEGCSSYRNCCYDYAPTCGGAPDPAPSPTPSPSGPPSPPPPSPPPSGGDWIPRDSPPSTALAYKGGAWPDMSVRGTGEMHIFAIGDWGGMDGSLITTGGRPRIIAYRGGETPGPHPFPRTRWNKPHSELLCSHDEFVECFNTLGSTCPAGCGFVNGVDTQPQLLVAAAFKARAAQKDPKLIINVGDNFYWGGIEEDCGGSMASISATTRHQFDQIFEGVYSGAGLSGVPWLSVLGNHDWGGRVFNNGWDQQIAYTWASDRWILPAPYWSQHVEFPDLGFSVDIFMVDSNFLDAREPSEDPEHNICSRLHNPAGADCSSTGGPSSVDACPGFFRDLWAEQKPWLERRLAESQADWQIVNTHFPCGHEAAFYSSLRANYGLDLLITGHRHDQELQSPSYALNGMTCLVAGGGGGITSEASPGPDHSQWYGEAQYGFYDITISKSRIYIESVNYDGEVVKTATVYPH